MKILAHVPYQYNQRREHYIVEITPEEITKVMNKVGVNDSNELRKRLLVGEDFPISEGYDFRRDLGTAFQRMHEGHEAFVKASLSMARFASIFQPTGEDTQDTERLNFLIENMASVVPWDMAYKVVNSQDGVMGRGSTPHDAIDNAMEAARK